MKKSLLLMAAASCATVALAQRSAMISQQSPTHAYLEQTADAQAQDVLLNGAKMNGKIYKEGENAAVKAWYNRPAGALYLTSYTTEGKAGYSTWYAPYLMMRPYESYAFNSASTSAASQHWKVWYQANMKQNIAEFDTDGFNYAWGLELDTVPQLTAVGSDGASSVYQPGAFNGTTSYVAMINTYPSYPAQINPSTTVVRHAWASPKFFGAKSNRDGSVKAGAYYGIVKDESGNSLGNLLGRNTAGIDAMAVAVEKPTHPYAVNAVGVRFQSLQMASSSAEAKLVANIYKVASIPAYAEPYVTITPGEKIASSTITMSDFVILNTPEFSKNSSTGKYSGIMYFPLEKTLNVDDAILVEITGYNTDAITDFTSLYSADYYEEGYGEIGYVKSGGEYKSMRGAHISSARSTAPAILLEVEYPFLTWNLSTETGEAEFPAEGGSKKVEVFTYHQAADMKISSADGGELPSWVSASVEDDMSSGEFGYLSYLTVNVQPQSVGAAPREASVMISYPGAKLVYHITQGQEQTGISDVNTANDVKVRKVYENGQVYIIKGDVKYNVMGAEVR